MQYKHIKGERHTYIHHFVHFLCDQCYSQRLLFGFNNYTLIYWDIEIAFIFYIIIEILLKTMT